MTDPRIPTPEQVRAVPVTSVRALCDGLKSLGLRIEHGGVHLHVFTADGTFVASVPNTPSDWRSLRNSRAQIARHIAQIAIRTPRRKS